MKNIERSFIDVDAGSHFPIQNLPYGVFTAPDRLTPRIGVAIGDYILDLAVIEDAGLFNNQLPDRVFHEASLNSFLQLGPRVWKNVRARISELLREDYPLLRDNESLRKTAIISRSDASMVLPVQVGEYTDFFSSREHAQNAAHILAGPDANISPNWLHVPICYNGRSSSIVVSGTPFYRPNCQRAPAAPGESAQFGPSIALDYELEMGSVIGVGNGHGSPVSVGDADSNIFGMTLLNDWSARDTQFWEAAPLGPFNGKIFCTSISPWIVTMDALAPFRVDGPVQDPTPVSYLRQSGPKNFDISLEAIITPDGGEPTTITSTNFRYLYWSTAQQIAHHTIAGCPLRPGDIIGSGTVSGAEPGSYGSMFELSRHGGDPIPLNGGKQRTYLEDGDTLAMTGWCQGDGYRVGFGAVEGKVLPAKAM